jgi:hypothetical protein
MMAGLFALGKAAAQREYPITVISMQPIFVSSVWQPLYERLSNQRLARAAATPTSP